MPNKDSYKKVVRCSFCGKTQDQVRRMVSGPNNTYICNECILLCQEIVSDDVEAVGRGGEVDIKKPQEIKEILEAAKYDSSIFITLDTLKYLKKGGRITPAAAAIGTVLGLKPVLQISGDKPDAYAKVRGKKAAKETMLEAMKKDFAEKYNGTDGKDIHLSAAYSGNLEEAQEWVKEIEEHFPGMDVHLSPLSLSVACHIGKGALAIACSKKIEY